MQAPKNINCINPLILNFCIPVIPRVVEEKDIKVYYDPSTQLSYMMGNDNQGPSRSYDGYKDTEEWMYSNVAVPGGTRREKRACQHHNDAERYTDD